MAELKCPLCGSRVEVPRVAVHTRYHCRKCHTPFHLNKAREGVVGDPPPVEQELAEIKQKLQQKWERVPVGRIVGGLVALVVVGLVWYYWTRPAQSLEGPAQAAEQAIADGDLDDLRSIAAPGTEDDVARWYNEVHPQLVRAREGWYGRDEVVEVQVGQEDPSQSKRVVAISINPAALGTNSSVSLADPTAATAPAATPFSAESVWTRSKWGRWQLDGRETYAKAHPAS